MIDSTQEFKAAVTADTRRTLLKAVIDIIDPDLVYGAVTNSVAASFAKPQQLINKTMNPNGNYQTLEHNRWLLNGNGSFVPAAPEELPGEVGYVSDIISGTDGEFSSPVWIEISFANVSILQALSVFFPDNDRDGVGADFTVEVKSGGVSYFTQEVQGNTNSQVSFEGFTVNYPDAIKITVHRWSLPGRRARVPEIVPGIYEEWSNDILAAFDIVQQSDISNVSLRYGTATLRMDNLDRRFEPRNKNGVFRSIDERQGIDLKIGMRLPDGSEEYKRAGIYYQHSGGWKTGDNGITMTWRLVDIVGLVAKREFIVPATLPTTLEGWIAAIVAQLGDNFKNRYSVDPNYASVSVAANSREDVTGKNCGDILRWVCMASGTWPRADSETGKLTAEPLWSEGNKLDLDNMRTYPIMKANDDMAALVFKLYDGENTQFVVSGTSASADKTASIDNPFIHTEAHALEVARTILAAYGGNQIETTGRGDPTSEIGDVDTVWLDESGATTGRRIYQTFNIKNGVLMDCKSTLLQADGSLLFEESEVITKSGNWTAPKGVTRLRLIIGQGGQGGMSGQDGYSEKQGLESDSDISNFAGAGGLNGVGGKIWHGTIDINDGQTFAVTIGRGGAGSSEFGVAGAEGEESSFGIHTSAEGKVYAGGFTDVASGNSYGRTGVVKPLAGSGDGGAGGMGGAAPIIVRVDLDEVQDDRDRYPTWKPEPPSGNRPGGGEGGVAPPPEEIPTPGGSAGSDSNPGGGSAGDNSEPDGDTSTGIPDGGPGNVAPEEGKPKEYGFIQYSPAGTGRGGATGGSGFVVVYWDREEVRA